MGQCVQGSGQTRLHLYNLLLLEILPPELLTKSTFSFHSQALSGLCVCEETQSGLPRPTESHLIATAASAPSTDTGFLFPTVLALSPPVVAQAIACVLSQARVTSFVIYFLPCSASLLYVFNVKQPGSGCGAPATAGAPPS